MYILHTVIVRIKSTTPLQITMSVNHQWRYHGDLLWYNDIVDRRANTLFIIDLGKPGRCDHFLNMREIETEHYVATSNSGFVKKRLRRWTSYISILLLARITDQHIIYQHQPHSTKPVTKITPISLDPVQLASQQLGLSNHSPPKHANYIPRCQPKGWVDLEIDVC